MLVSMVFDDDDETSITAIFDVGGHVMQLKQKPDEGRYLDKDKEARQEQAMTAADSGAAAPLPSSSAAAAASGVKYDSAFPNVGLVVWQAGFVLGEYLVRTQPLGSWQQGLKVLDLGCGTGQLGIALALAGAAVTLTDLDYIVGLTRTNVDLNAARCAIKPVVQPYLWGAPVSGVRQAGGGQQPDGEQQPDGVQQPEQQAEQQQHSKQQHWDAIVAADVLYEPQYYDALLAALLQLCPVVSPCQPEAAAAVDTSIQQQQQQQPSPPVFICFRVRKYRESTFEAKAAAAGFDVAEVAVSELHGDYRCGGYRLITLRRVREASTAKQSQEGQQRERT